MNPIRLAGIPSARAKSGPRGITITNSRMLTNWMAPTSAMIARSPFVPCCVVRARPIGVLKLEDEAGGDEKLVCVPVDTTFPYYSDIGERQDLPSIVLQQIEHFFKHYKDLEEKKWVRIGQWGDAAEARKILLEAIEAARGAKAD